MKQELEIALTTYISLKHTQEECIGFIDGFEAAEQRMYSEEDLRNAHLMGANFAYGRKEATKDDRVSNFDKWFTQYKKD
jgi:hypothetical protein